MLLSQLHHKVRLVKAFVCEGARGAPDRVLETILSRTWTSAMILKLTTSTCGDSARRIPRIMQRSPSTRRECPRRSGGASLNTFGLAGRQSSHNCSKRSPSNVFVSSPTRNSDATDNLAAVASERRTSEALPFEETSDPCVTPAQRYGAHIRQDLSPTPRREVARQCLNVGEHMSQENVITVGAQLGSVAQKCRSSKVFTVKIHLSIPHDV